MPEEEQNAVTPAGTPRPVESEPQYKRTKDHLDWIKWLAGTVLALVAAGWAGHSYIAQFQTTDQATRDQDSNNEAHQGLRDGLRGQEEQLDGLEQDIEIYSVRMELQQRNVSDRLDRVIADQGARTPAQRRVVEAEWTQTRARIRRRQRVLNSPRALKSLAAQAREDPAGAFDDL